jgi:exopolysaccharide biosynthesis polyprenyl glycosylphosphotransferase
MQDTSAVAATIAAEPVPAELETPPISAIGAGERPRLAPVPARAESGARPNSRIALAVITDLLLLLLPVVAATASRTVPVYGALWLFPLLAIAALALRGVYRTRLRLSALEDAGRVVVSTAFAAMGVLALRALIAGPSTPSLGGLTVRVWLASTALVVVGHAFRARVRRTEPASEPRTRILIVGGGDTAALLERRLKNDPQGLQVIGYLDIDRGHPDSSRDGDAAVLGTPSDLRRVVIETRADHVIFGFASVGDRGLVPLVRECRALGVSVSVVPRLFEAMNSSVSVEHLGGLPVIRLRHVDPKGWQFAVKHAFDRIAAAIILLLLLPVLLILAAAVKLSSAGPILYRQRRVGRDGRSFVMLKFRSMRVAPAGPPAFSPEARERADLAPGGVEGDDRRTVIGTLLRKTSLDELPQLVNILRGEMSLVGPRPERPEFVERFGTAVPGYGDRHRVKSGLTGWAQVSNLRGQTSLRDRVEWDNYYIENWSLLLDLKILLMTVPAVLRSVE